MSDPTATDGRMPVYVPPADPSSLSSPPPARPPLTQDQAVKVAQLIDHFNSSIFSPPCTLAELKSSRRTGFFAAATKPVGRPLNEVELCYWSREAICRCLRATKWDATEALKRCEDILVWRRDFAGGVDDLDASTIEHEASTGKELILGYDSQQRPILYMHPNRQNTAASAVQLEFVVWCLERAIDLTTTDDTICLCIDLNSAREDGKIMMPSPGQGIKVLGILQTYYCERLGRAICVNVPKIFWAFFSVVRNFIDPVTRDKIQFNVDAAIFVPREQLQRVAFGGDFDFEFKHDLYFPAIVALCAERKAANLDRWRKFGGGKCGIEERIIKGIAERAPADGGEAASSTIQDGFENSNQHDSGLSLSKLEINDDKGEGVASPAELAA